MLTLRGVSALMAVILAADATAQEIVLLKDGRSLATVYAPGESQWAGLRLVDRLARFTGVELDLQTREGVPAGTGAILAVGTPASNAIVKELLGQDPRLTGLGEDGYILKAGVWQGRPVLAAAGSTLPGAHNAVSELISWKIKLAGGQASVPGNMDESDQPALKYRLLWNWDSRTNWRLSVDEMHGIHHQRYNLIEEGEVAFVTHLERAIDYFSDHKLNGLIVWGFIRDAHGGLEAAREVCRYGRRNNVRLLPGVCTEAAYGGFTYSPDSPYNLEHWTAKHPELRYRDSGGKDIAGVCPSKPENQQWLRDGTRWFFEALPDAGGMSLENGDWFYCWTPDCVEAKAQKENDPNFFWDELASYKPVIETAKQVRPDSWMVFASYTGFTEDTIRGAMQGAVKTKRAMGAATEVVYPPRMLQQMPAGSICQWTLTGMAGAHAWAAEAQPPPAAFEDNIGYIHQSGAVSGLSDPGKWWGCDPGSGYEEVADIIRFVCGRLAGSKMNGLVMYGERSAVSPANDLNYLAMEYFSWHPERTWEQFIQDRLTTCYGAGELAPLYLKMLRSSSRDATEIGKDQARAAQIAGGRELDARQRPRWQNLSCELARRARLAKDMSAATPAP